MTDHVSDQIGSEVLFENDRVRVWELTLQPGESSPRHRHTSDYLFVQITPTVVEVHQGGDEPSVEECDVGFVEYTEVGSGIEHSIVNKAATPLREIIVEFIGPSRSATPQEPQTNGRSRSIGG